MPDAITSDTSPAVQLPTSKPSPQAAAQGIGQAGCVQIPPDIWMSAAPGGLLLADAHTPPHKPSKCPLVQQMLDSLLAAGMVALHAGLPNAEAFVKWKSASKCALIIDMRSLNAHCPFPPPKFRLPTLLEIGGILRSCHHPPGHISTLDLANCFWSIKLPPSNIGCIRIGTPRHTYTLLCVPFGWSHAPGLVQRVIHRTLQYAQTPPTPRQAPAAVPASIVQYLDDIAIIAPSADTLAHTLNNAVHALTTAGFLISPKSLLTPHPSATFIGKHLDAGMGTISTLPTYYASILILWLRLATGPCTRRLASRLLGKLVWLA